MKKLLLGLFLALPLADPSQAASLTNGSFEQPGGAPIRASIGIVLDFPSIPSVPGWTHSGTGLEIYESSGQSGIPAQDGSYYISWGHQHRLVPPSTGGVLSQDFAVTSGIVYTTSFWMSTQQVCPGCETQTQSVNVSIINLADLSTLFSANYSVSGNPLWTQFIFNFLAVSPNARIVFTDTTTASNSAGINWGLDNVSVVATPLPAALPLFATGLGAMGLLVWRRKRKAQAAA